jgi:hypothetical protein
VKSVERELSSDSDEMVGRTLFQFGIIQNLSGSEEEVVYRPEDTRRNPGRENRSRVSQRGKPCEPGAFCGRFPHGGAVYLTKLHWSARKGWLDSRTRVG